MCFQRNECKVLLFVHTCKYSNRVFVLCDLPPPIKKGGKKDRTKGGGWRGKEMNDDHMKKSLQVRQHDGMEEWLG